MKVVKNLILCLIFVSLIASFVSLKNLRKHDSHINYETFASSSSSYSLKRGDNGITREFNHEEKYEDKNGDNPVEKREYEESLNQKEDGSAVVKKKAATNVEKERIILPDITVEKHKKFDFGDYYEGLRNRGTGLRHALYDDYFNYLTENIFDQEKNNNKHNDREKHNRDKTNLKSKK